MCVCFDCSQTLRCAALDPVQGRCPGGLHHELTGLDRLLGEEPGPHPNTVPLPHAAQQRELQGQVSKPGVAHLLAMLSLVVLAVGNTSLQCGFVVVTSCIVGSCLETICRLFGGLSGNCF